MAPILEATSATTEVEVPIPSWRPLALGKRKESSVAVPDIEKETESSQVPILEAVVS